VPQPLTYPGVYVEEVPGGSRPIAGVATSVAAFIGRARKGPTDRAVPVSSYAEFLDEFGPLWESSRLGFAVRDFYANGGRHAVVCRLYVAPAEDDPGVATISVGEVTVVAASPGAWGNGLRVTVDHAGIEPGGELFNLTVAEVDGRSERFAGLSLYEDRVRNVGDVLARESRLARWAGTLLDPPAPGEPRTGPADGSDAAGAKEADARAARAAVATAVGEAARTAAAEAAAEEARQQADERVAGATTADQQAAQALADADAEVAAAQALDQSVPENQEKLAKAQEKQAIATTKRTEAAAALAAAQQAAQDAATAATTAAGTADAATQAADTAKQAATQAEADATAASDFGGDDGGDADPATLSAQAGPLLAKADIFNLLCIPPYKADGSDVEPAVFDWAASVCAARRALLLVDPPSSWTTVGAAVDGFRAEADQLGGRSPNAAVYFPRLQQPNPLRDDGMESFVPCGAVAGVMARIDATRGVWKAPAGLEAGLRGVRGLTVPLDDDGNGRLNPLGVNCLRGMGAAGRVVWGARTLAGADSLASEWKYVPVRRLALFIEESLFRGTRWVVFEPNDEPLWAQIRLSVGSFMHQLFRQRAFQGQSPRDAYFVKCDAETTTQADRDRGVVNISVGFAPLKPAEFVVVRLQQLAGQSEA
jgi:hypothetical protein